MKTLSEVGKCSTAYREEIWFLDTPLASLQQQLDPSPANDKKCGPKYVFHHLDTESSIILIHQPIG